MATALVTKRHIRIDHFHRSTNYKSKRRANNPSVPIRSNPKSHGQTLLGTMQQIQREYETLAQTWEGSENIRARGISIEIESALQQGIDGTRLEAGGWELLNERAEKSAGHSIYSQLWFVPDGKLNVLATILSDYLSKTVTRKGVVKPMYSPLVDAIEKIGIAAAHQLWTEHDTPFPLRQTTWFEVWLRRGASELDRAAILGQFEALSSTVGLRVGKGRINLPEHTILAAYGTGEVIAKDLALLSCIAELRQGRDYADFFDAMQVPEQAAWASDLAKRTRPADSTAPFITILDTGINRGHPVLQTHIPAEHNQTINQEWTAADDCSHGTMMAGLCLFGDLTSALANSASIQLQAHVEGVKIVPPPAQRPSDEKLAGAYTAQGMALAEINAPERRRVWCVATTMKDPNHSIPTSWSAQMDALACGADNDRVRSRLICLSAGNIPQSEWPRYPNSNYTYSIENPGQAWNAVSVGAFTNFDLVRDAKSYRALAPRGTLSPSSSTSLKWDSAWPNKPDVVFEGGNAGFQSVTNSTLQLPELLVLSTYGNFHKGSFAVIPGTSPATALAARMAAAIMAEYPDFQTETLRGLLVHSAEWTTGMRGSFKGKKSSKRDQANFLLRTVGYGVPNLRRAMECANNRATMIAESEIQPFKEEGDDVVFSQMHLHRLPWPEAELSRHSQEKVRMRVTVSYFIEPNPGNRGYTSQYRYASCALRFRASSPGQTEEDLVAQVNKIAADEFAAQKQVHVRGTTDGWLLGDACFRGSVHSDIWQGTAADLLSMRYVAVYPTTGWWRTRSSLRKAESRLKYSLIVSVEAENPTLDIYTEIETKAKIAIRT